MKTLVYKPLTLKILHTMFFVERNDCYIHHFCTGYLRFILVLAAWKNIEIPATFLPLYMISTILDGMHFLLTNIQSKCLKICIYS